MQDIKMPLRKTQLNIIISMNTCINVNVPVQRKFISQEVQNLIEAQKAVWKIKKKQLLSLQAKDRLIHRYLHSLQCNNSWEIMPPSREWCRILEHSCSLFSHLVFFWFCKTSSCKKTLERSGLSTFSALGPRKLLLCVTCAKYCCRMLGLDGGKCFFVCVKRDCSRC